MSVERETIKRIRNRWTTERKISAADVAWLLQQADAADTMRSANGLTDAASRVGYGDFFDALFGGRR